MARFAGSRTVELWNWKIGNRKSEIGNRKSEIGNRKSEIGKFLNWQQIPNPT
jgi:hypothetical protein